MHETDTRAARIAELNDAFRTSFIGGHVHITSGVKSLGEDAVSRAVEAVQSFDAFTEDNDPYGEHDFGAFEVDGHRLHFKVDYYDAAMEYGSEDPADPGVTTRVLTVMLADEY